MTRKPKGEAVRRARGVVYRKDAAESAEAAAPSKWRKRSLIGAPLVAGGVVTALLIGGAGGAGSAERDPGTVAGSASTVAPVTADADGRVELNPAATQPAGVEAVDGVVSVDVGELLPDSATMYAFLPTSTPRAWDLVSRLMDSRTQLANIDLTGSDVGDLVGIVGYASIPSDGDRFAYSADSANTREGALSVAYLATASDDSARAVQDFLNDQPEIVQNYLVGVQGTVVILTSVWADPLKLSEGARLASRSDYQPSIETLGQTDSSLWVDLDGYLDSRAAALPEAERAAARQYAEDALGAKDVYWVASQDGDSAYSWSGSYVGAMLEQVDVEAAGAIQGALMEPYLAATTVDGDDVGVADGTLVPDEVIRATGAMSALSGVTVSEDGSAELSIDTVSLDRSYLSAGGTPNIVSWDLQLGADGALRLTFAPSDSLWTIDPSTSQQVATEAPPTPED